MKQLIKGALNAIPYVNRLRLQVEKQGMFPAGHYYSPIPDKEDITIHLQGYDKKITEIDGIDLHREKQSSLLEEFSRFYPELPFPDEPGGGCRYYYKNPYFLYADAIFLYSFLRKFKPKRIIEVGSGFSSAVMLETAERFLEDPVQMTFIEPYPERLHSLLRQSDKGKVTIIPEKVQRVPLEIFGSLEAGDLLFIDSSHVVKSGSDLQLLLFEVLPLLPPGVFVHFHDIFYPFEYPASWLESGRYWNENYFLRAFLTDNTQWEICFFNTYVCEEFGDFLAEKMPLCLKDSGGSLYLKKQPSRNLR